MPGSVFPGLFERNERANSQPVHTYTFSRANVLWQYTDQPQDVTVDGVAYRAAVISHSEYERDDETAAGELTVTVAVDTPIVSDLDAIGMDGRPILLTIRQTHRAGVGGAVPTTVVRYKGHVVKRSIKGAECEFLIASIDALLGRPLLRWTCQPTCNKTVYGPGCGVDPAPFTTAGCAVSTIAGVTLTVPDAAAQADGYYTAGYLVIESGSAAGEPCFISAHVGDQLTLLKAPPQGLTTSDTIAITAGCDGLESTCITKFNNVDYFAGFPRVPVVNPFDQVM
jgi:uncharacterized phage protein (TIGR02218 family)